MHNSAFLKSSHCRDLADMQCLEQRSLLSASVLGFHGDAASTGVSRLIANTESDGEKYVYHSGPYVLGTGDGAIKVAGQSRVYFNALRELQRPGLALSGGRILIGFASHGDNGPFHGWLLSYDEAVLGLRGVLNTTPNGGDGGIWQSGGIVTADSAGVLYVATGNGMFDGDAGGNGKVIGLNSHGFPVNADYGNCFLKIAADPTTTIANPNQNGWGLKVIDYFSPYNNHDLDAVDTDLGSGGLVLLPDSAGSARHRHLLVGAGKEGTLYLVDRDNMGKFHLGGDAVVESVDSAIGGSYDTPAFFNGSLYYAGADDQARMFKVAGGHISDPTSQSADRYAFTGSTPTISANGIAQGIVWDLDRGTNQLRAYDAANYAHELWTSTRAPNGRDALGQVVKFTVPAVADGEVLVGTATALVRYGLAATPP